MEAPSYGNRIDFRMKVRAYLAWFAERFPLLNVLSSFLLFFFIYACSTYGRDNSLSFKELVLPFGILTQLLLLRILDEFKDHSYDKEHHPDRVLQQGILKLDDLKILAFAGFAVQIFLNLKWGALLNPWWLGMTVWTVLMTREFFIGEWLRKKIFLYLLSHMMVMIFLVCWILSFYSPSTELRSLVVLVIFSGSVLYELSRKTRGLDEDSRLDSYPAEIGFFKHGLLLLLIGCSVLTFKILTLRTLNTGFHWVYLWDIAAAVVFFLSIGYMHLKKSKKARKLLEANYGGLMFAVYLSLVLHVFIWS